jgi:hypothetical protein
MLEAKDFEEPRLTAETPSTQRTASSWGRPIPPQQQHNLSPQRSQRSRRTSPLGCPPRQNNSMASHPRRSRRTTKNVTLVGHLRHPRQRHGSHPLKSRRTALHGATRLYRNNSTASHHPWTLRSRRNLRIDRLSTSRAMKDDAWGSGADRTSAEPRMGTGGLTTELMGRPFHLGARAARPVPEARASDCGGTAVSPFASVAQPENHGVVGTP